MVLLLPHALRPGLVFPRNVNPLMVKAVVCVAGAGWGLGQVQIWDSPHAAALSSCTPL